MIWPFKKKAQPSQPKDLRDDSEGWLVGDLALCLTSNWPGHTGPRSGEVYRVSSVIEGPVTCGPDIGALVVALNFGEVFSWEAYNCRGFRKIRPDTEPCEAEFTALIKRGARKPVRV